MLSQNEMEDLFRRMHQGDSESGKKLFGELFNGKNIPGVQQKFLDELHCLVCQSASKVRDKFIGEFFCGKNNKNRDKLNEILFHRMRQPDSTVREKARELLAMGNQNLVYAIIRRYNPSKNEKEDMNQDGCEGLLKAIKGFKIFLLTKQSLANLREEGIPADILSKLEGLQDGYMVEERFIRVLETVLGKEHADKYQLIILKHARRNFSTYARKAIEREIWSAGRKSVPRTVQKVLYSVERLQQKLERIPTVEEITAESGFTRKQVIKALEVSPCYFPEYLEELKERGIEPGTSKEFGMSFDLKVALDRMRASPDEMEQVYSKILIKFHIEDKSLKGIAEELKKSVGYVKGTKSRAERKLRQDLEGGERFEE